MLPGNKPDPGRQVASGRECLPIAHLGDQCSSNDRADARNLLEPPAFFTRSVPGMDMLLNDPDLSHDSGILRGKSVEAESCNCCGASSDIPAIQRLRSRMSPSSPASISAAMSSKPQRRCAVQARKSSVQPLSA